MGRIQKSFILLWISHFCMDFFTGIWPVFKTIAKIDIATAGLIAGLSGFLGEFLQLGFGLLCDRGHRKKILFLGLFLASSIMWVTFVDKITHTFLLLLLLMIGSASFHPAAVGIASNLSKGYKGRGILIFTSGGALGFAISQLTFTKLISLFNGHAIIIIIPICVLLGILLLHQFPKEEGLSQLPSWRNILDRIAHCRKPLLLLYLAQVTSQFLVIAFMFLLPDLLQAKQLPHWLCLGGGHFCFVLSSACAMIPAGYLSDRFGQKKVLLCSLLFASTILYLFLFQNFSYALSIMCLCLIGAFLGIVNPVIVSWGNRLVPDAPSVVSALLMGFAWCVAHLGPLGVGIIAPCFTHNPFHYTLAIIGCFLILCFFLVLATPRPQPQIEPVAGTST